jgi:hypothetical protein
MLLEFDDIFGIQVAQQLDNRSACSSHLLDSSRLFSIRCQKALVSIVPSPFGDV